MRVIIEIPHAYWRYEKRRTHFRRRYFSNASNLISRNINLWRGKARLRRNALGYYPRFKF